jgi:GNAT superfamily N-acetyltransferase
MADRKSYHSTFEEIRTLGESEDAVLQQLIQEGKRAMTLAERFRVIVEIVAYVMLTGPKGGQFYYTPKGTKVYRKLGGQSGKARKLAQLTGEAYDAAWASMKPDGQPMVYPTGVAMGRALKRIFGDKAPDPKMLSEMFSDMGIDAAPVRISLSEDRISVKYDVKEANGTSIGDMERVFYRGPKGPEVYHDFLSIDEAWQGGGRAAAMLGKAMKAYKQLGVKKVEVTAALDAGPYVWARFGFKLKGFPGVPPEEVFAGKKKNFSKFIQKLGVSKEASEKIVAGVKDMHGLSGVRVQVPDPKTGKYTTIKAGKDFLLHGSDSGRPQGWPGSLDLDDPKAVARWQRQTAKGRKQRKAAMQAGRNTHPLSQDEVEALDAARKARVEHYKKLLSASAPTPGPSARDLMRRLGTRPRA